MPETKVSEASIERHLVARVKARGGLVRKVSWIGVRGAPDRLVMLPGQFPLWVELKAPGEKVEPHQQREHDRLRLYGQHVVVIDSFEGVDAVVGGRA